MTQTMLSALVATGEFDLANLKPGYTLTARTRNTEYILTTSGLNVYFIDGHAKYCPTPRRYNGQDIIAVGGSLIFATDEHPQPIVTSRVRSLKLHYFEGDDEVVAEYPAA